LFLLLLAFACYSRPVSNDFDRYIYEAIVRVGRSEPLDSVYDAVKHESPRAEASSTLDSPEQLRDLMPLFAILPLYLILISIVAYALGIQGAINAISAVSLFGIGIVVLAWTQRPLLTALFFGSVPDFYPGKDGNTRRVGRISRHFSRLAHLRT
jgi:hypothetical protein